MNDPNLSRKDDELTLTLPRSQWEAILSVEPLDKETYTDAGITLFNAFQAIHHLITQA